MFWNKLRRRGPGKYALSFVSFWKPFLIYFSIWKYVACWWYEWFPEPAACVGGRKKLISMYKLDSVFMTITHRFQSCNAQFANWCWLCVIFRVMLILWLSTLFISPDAHSLVAIRGLILHLCKSLSAIWISGRRVRSFCMFMFQTCEKRFKVCLNPHFLKKVNIVSQHVHYSSSQKVIASSLGWNVQFFSFHAVSVHTGIWWFKFRDGW